MTNTYFVKVTISDTDLDTECIKEEIWNVFEGLRRKEAIGDFHFEIVKRSL